MKKYYFAFVAFCFLSFGNAQIINFPDAIFKARLLAASTTNQIAKNLAGNNFKIDADSDGEIQQSEALQVSFLNISNSFISSITGISFFTALTNLNCNTNGLASLNLSSNIALSTLFCSSNGLSSLNLISNTLLTNLKCNNNILTSLNLSGIISLTDLDCNTNLLAILDLSSNTSLMTLNTYNNQQLTNLNLSSNTSLTVLNCSNNALTNLNLTSNSFLTNLNCSFNPLVGLNVSNNIVLTSLTCVGNQLMSLDLSYNIALTNLSCFFNQLTILNLINNTQLLNVSCNNNRLNSLFIKNGISEKINFSYNPNIQFICADESQVNQIQTTVNNLGYINCNVNSNCNLENQDFEFTKFFNLYPNPANNSLNIETKNDIIISSLSIYNTIGQLVQVITSPNKTVDVSELKAGSYFVKIISDKGTSSSKFMKE